MQTQPSGNAPAARPRGDFNIPSLDGLRAVSFLIVFLAHTTASVRVPGAFGVTVFFFLSGYLITSLLRLEHTSSGRVSLRDFYLRRVLRILPPFYAVLLLAALLTLSGALPGTLSTWPMVAQIGHVTNYWNIVNGAEGQPAGTGVYWSLAVEEHFYLVFPFLFILLQRVFKDRFRAQGAVLLALCGLVLAWRFALVFGLGATPERTGLASDTRVDSILFGCALAVMANPMLDKQRLPAWLWRWVLLPLGMGLLLVSFLYRAPWFRESLRYTVQGMGLIPLFVVSMREPDFLPFRLLNLKWVKHVGLLSYSLYLIHQVVIFTVHPLVPGLHPLWRGALELTVALLLAEVVHRLIEKPCARLRRRLAHANWISPRATSDSPPEAAAALASKSEEGPAGLLKVP